MAVAVMAPPVLVTPSVHYAVLSHVSPKAGIKATMPFAELLLQGWKHRDYAQLAASTVASSIGGSLKPESIEEIVDDTLNTLSCVHEGANEAWIVYPKVVLKLPNGTEIEIWGRTHLPTTRFTKGYRKNALAMNWTSVNMHGNGSDRLEQMTTQLDKLSGTLEMYKRTAFALSNWEYARMREENLVGNGPNQPQYQDIHPEGGALVTAIAVRDERLKDYFEMIRDEKDNELMEMLAKNQEVQELFLTYFRAAGLDSTITIASALQDKLFWKTEISEGIERGITKRRGKANEEPSSRESVLYVVRQELKAKLVKNAVGIGYDRTISAQLAARSSFQMELLLKQML